MESGAAAHHTPGALGWPPEGVGMGPAREPAYVCLCLRIEAQKCCQGEKKMDEKKEKKEGGINGMKALIHICAQWLLCVCVCVEGVHMLTAVSASNVVQIAVKTHKHTCARTHTL